MANLTVICRPPGKRTGAINDLFEADFVEEYSVKTDDPAVTAEEVALTLDLPLLFERYSNIPNTYGYYSFVKEIKPKQSPDSPWLWFVEVLYSTKISEECRQKLNPLEVPPRFKKRSQRATRPVEYDDDGNPMVNSAGLPFDPPYEKEENNTLLIVQKNEASIDLDRDEGFEDSVNSEIWYGGAPGTWKCVAIDGDEGWERGTYVIPTTYQFLYNRRGWTGYHVDGSVLFPEYTRILDVGKAERLNGKVNVILDLRGHPIPDKVCMDGRGLRLEAGPDRSTKLTATILAAGTTVTVSNPYALVQGQQAKIYHEDVIIDTINLATKTLTLVRAVNGTTAAEHASGDVIFQKSGTSTVLQFTINSVTDTLNVDDPLVFGFVSRAPGGTITFPAHGIVPFIRIDNEEMLVTAVSSGSPGALLTVARGANGSTSNSTAAAHLANAEVRQAPTYINRALHKLEDFWTLGIGGQGGSTIEHC